MLPASTFQADVASVNIFWQYGHVMHVAPRSSDPRPSTGRGYHHGDLRRSLLITGVELARDGGPDAVTLREASRRLGVSHNAAYRHYADREALLEEVAGHGFQLLAKAIRAELKKVPVRDAGATAIDRLHALGQCYVSFALRNPGLYRTMFAAKTEPPQQAREDDDPDRDPFGLLISALDDLVEAGVMPPENRPLAEFAAWSGVHGLSDMFLDGPLCGLSKRERRPIIDRTLAAIGSGLIAGTPRVGPPS